MRVESTEGPSLLAPRLQKCRVAHLLVGFSVGGVENQLLRVLPRLEGTGAENVVFALKGWGPMADEFRSRGIRTVALGGLGKGDLRVLVRLYRLLKTERVDILQCYTSRANWAGALVGRLARVPAVILSDRDVRTWMRPWHRWVDRSCFGLARGIVVPSEAIRGFDVDHLGFPSERIWVVPNGVDAEAFAGEVDPRLARRALGIAEDMRWVGFVGRLDSSVKGLDVLLRSFQLLETEKVSPSLLLVGEGPSERELRRRSRGLGLESRVSFMGLRRDIPQVLATLDILVLPSFQEGSPNVVLEAMAAGVPVVATGVGGTREIIEHGKTGWLVPPGDPGALAEGIRQMLANPSLARDMARAAKNWVRANRSMDATARGFASIYAQVQASTAAPTGIRP
jgi:glycosyltransferase involved in cell wall biosynthesis